VTAANGRRKNRPGWRILRILGPGLITGASDDDPSGIGTYSQVGAQFGYGMSWVMLFSYPLMCAIQEISARIGRVTGSGIAGNIRRHYSPWLLYPIVALLLVANTINLGADLGAMGDVVRMLIGGPPHLYVIFFGIFCVLLQTYVQYARYVSILKWSTLSLFAYVGTALIVDVHWGEVARHTLIPSFSFNGDYITAIVAVMGTTISPYLFFWQSSQESEDQRVDPKAHALVSAPAQAPAALKRIRLDTYFGMGVSNLIALFIIITTAATSTRAASLISRPRPRRPRRCARSRGALRLSSSLLASSAPACSPFPCSRDLRPMPLAKRAAGRRALHANRSRPRPFTLPWRSRRRLAWG